VGHDNPSLEVPEMKTLLVVSHVRHYQFDEKLFAYGPYTKEIDLWAELFDEVVIAAPLRNERPPGFAEPFLRSNIEIAKQIETGGDGIFQKLLQIVLLPIHILKLASVMKSADAIHVRCPGNLGLLGVILAPLFSDKLIAKYAGQWPDYDGEPWTYRLQKKILKSRWWKGPVTVYGEWPDQPEQIKPFFTSMMTREQVQQAVSHAKKKIPSTPFRILFSGRLTKEKGVHHLIEAVLILKERGSEIELAVVGNGPEFEVLQRSIAEKLLEKNVRIVGDVPYEESIKSFEWGDVLVLPSKSEGFPKVIAEAMCHGMVCIGMNSGLVPQMLDGRGLVIEKPDALLIANAIESLMNDSKRFTRLSIAGIEWASQYSIEDLQDALRTLMEESWGVKLQSEGTSS
jgi:glycosyltransferase involved in cell wall biosynthesis